MELRKEGILLDRHHTYLWCSPTRRAFLTGRYPVHVTGTQAPTCSNWTPLQFTILSEKLAAVDYEAHFIGTCCVLLLSCALINGVTICGFRQGPSRIPGEDI